MRDKYSHFNSKLIVDVCKICGNKDNLETHHIFEQHTADEDGYITVNGVKFHKNVLLNLVVLCEKCHRTLHETNKKINMQQTTNGLVYQLM